VQAPVVVMLQFTAMSVMGARASIWRYTGMAHIRSFLYAGLVAVALIAAARLGLPRAYQVWRVPLSVNFVDTMLAFGATFGLRVLRRSIYENTKRRQQTKNVSENGKRLRATAGGMVLRGILIVCLIVLFGYGVAWIGGEPVVSKLQSADTDFGQSGASNHANTSRRQMWSTTWKVFKDRPLAGIGFGAYWIGVTKYHEASGELTPQEAHNDYLDLLAAGGLFGSALAIWFVVVFLSKARKQLRSPDPYRRAACLGALAGVFGVAVHSFVDFGLHVTVNAAVFILLIVIATANIRVEVRAYPVPR